ncbi:MAG TPA: cytochrome b/b6 domain-containing protein [Permianibacter sp.]|nr:cytochrome b/b6 domain-containing protein [Permianibacter sp.]
MTERIKVWDPLVRLFHWALVLAFFLAYLTGEEDTPVHVYAGYVITGLILFRLLWGFVSGGFAGASFARFRSFLFSPAETLAYVRDSKLGKAKHYLGHNPIGALMVFALLFSLSGTVFTGLAMNGDLPFLSAGAEADAERATRTVSERAHDDDEDDESEAGEVESNSAAHALHEQWEEVHELFANLTLLLVALHIVGIVLASRLHKEKLVPAMITGWKETTTDQRD